MVVVAKEHSHRDENRCDNSKENECGFTANVTIHGV